jgi:hypothetical protein
VPAVLALAVLGNMQGEVKREASDAERGHLRPGDLEPLDVRTERLPHLGFRDVHTGHRAMQIDLHGVLDSQPLGCVLNQRLMHRLLVDVRRETETGENHGGLRTVRRADDQVDVVERPRGVLRVEPVGETRALEQDTTDPGVFERTLDFSGGSRNA